MRSFGRLKDKWISHSNLKNHDTSLPFRPGFPHLSWFLANLVRISTTAGFPYLHNVDPLNVPEAFVDSSYHSIQSDFQKMQSVPRQLQIAKPKCKDSIIGFLTSDFACERWCQFERQLRVIVFHNQWQDGSI